MGREDIQAMSHPSQFPPICQKTGSSASLQKFNSVPLRPFSSDRPQVKGKFLYVGLEKLWIRGVTYGTFRPDVSGNEFHDQKAVERDFAQMVANGINAVRTYTTPPPWLLDIAWQQGLYVMAGLPWESHLTFLDTKKTVRVIEERVRLMVRQLTGHPALLCYVIGNEIPAPIIRWYGRKKIERFLERLYVIAKTEDPQGLVTYVNFPTTEYLQLPFLDFSCFNVYLEKPDSFEAYLRRLQNITGDRPLIMGELGLDSRRNGEKKQAEVLDWQIRTAFQVGCAGVFVYAWTDEWHRGGHDIEDWDFGITDRKRHPKPALRAVRQAFTEVPFPPDITWPRISVVVCSYNGMRTIGNCCEGLHDLDYPNYEVICVDDGSTDNTAAIAGINGFRVIRTPNNGLSGARNVGMRVATGDIVAYIDDDAYPDRDWLKYLAYTFLSTDCAGVGGPNIPPPGDGDIAECVANSPGGPLHVLLSDHEAEHIPGCNMAYRKDVLEALGGFDPKFRAAGDDVDLCWRLLERGWWLAFNPAAMVWHHRRNSIRAYLKQQIGYGRAEAFLERKWPEKYNRVGHYNWIGRIYGGGLSQSFFWRKWRIYHGTWGTAFFQSLYNPKVNTLESMLLMPEWYLINGFLGALVVLGLLWKPLLLAIPLLVLTAGLPLLNVIRGAATATFPNENSSRIRRLKLRSITGLLHILQPMARLLGRLRYGLSPWRLRGKTLFAFPWPQTCKIWSERWQTPEQKLQSIEEGLKFQGAIVTRGGDFDHWDLNVRGGLLGSAQLRMTVEEHGAGRQYWRFLTYPRWSLEGVMLTLPVVILSLGAAFDQALLVSGILGGVAVLLVLRTFQECAGATGAMLNALKQEKQKNEIGN